jgi:hypothetical protein
VVLFRGDLRRAGPRLLARARRAGAVEGGRIE